MYTKVEGGHKTRRPYVHNFVVATELVDSFKDGSARRVTYSRTSNQRRLMLAKMIEFDVLIVVERYYSSPTVKLNPDPLVVELFEQYVRQIFPDCGLAKAKGFRRMTKEEFVEAIEAVRLKRRTTHQTYLISSPSPKLMAS